MRTTQSKVGWYSHANRGKYALNVFVAADAAGNRQMRNKSVMLRFCYNEIVCGKWKACIEADAGVSKQTLFPEKNQLNLIEKLLSILTLHRPLELFYHLNFLRLSTKYSQRKQSIKRK